MKNQIVICIILFSCISHAGSELQKAPDFSDKMLRKNLDLFEFSKKKQNNIMASPEKGAWFRTAFLFHELQLHIFSFAPLELLLSMRLISSENKKEKSQQSVCNHLVSGLQKASEYWFNNTLEKMFSDTYTKYALTDEVIYSIRKHSKLGNIKSMLSIPSYVFTLCKNYIYEENSEFEELISSYLFHPIEPGKLSDRFGEGLNGEKKFSINELGITVCLVPELSCDGCYATIRVEISNAKPKTLNFLCLGIDHGPDLSSLPSDEVLNAVLQRMTQSNNRLSIVIASGILSIESGPMKLVSLASLEKYAEYIDQLIFTGILHLYDITWNKEKCKTFFSKFKPYCKLFQKRDIDVFLKNEIPLILTSYQNMKNSCEEYLSSIYKLYLKGRFSGQKLLTLHIANILKSQNINPKSEGGIPLFKGGDDMLKFLLHNSKWPYWASDALRYIFSRYKKDKRFNTCWFHDWPESMKDVVFKAVPSAWGKDRKIITKFLTGFYGAQCCKSCKSDFLNRKISLGIADSIVFDETDKSSHKNFVELYMKFVDDLYATIKENPTQWTDQERLKLIANLAAVPFKYQERWNRIKVLLSQIKAISIDDFGLLLCRMIQKDRNNEFCSANRNYLIKLIKEKLTQVNSVFEVAQIKKMKKKLIKHTKNFRERDKICVHWKTYRQLLEEEPIEINSDETNFELDSPYSVVLKNKKPIFLSGSLFTVLIIMWSIKKYDLWIKMKNIFNVQKTFQ